MANKSKKAKEYKEPSESEKLNLYRIYELIYDNHFSLPKKRSVMTAVLGYETWSWRVVGITEEAIKAIAKNNFNKPSNTLARDHTHTRSNTYTKIFSEGKMPFHAWWDWVWQHDKTILMTNTEHKSQVISKIYQLNPNDGYFVDGETAGWYQTKAKEGSYLKHLCEVHSISY